VCGTLQSVTSIRADPAARMATIAHLETRLGQPRRAGAPTRVGPPRAFGDSGRGIVTRWHTLRTDLWGHCNGWLLARYRLS
jgi:hypothetical protein